jgi:four helix bundle protein
MPEGQPASVLSFRDLSVWRKSMDLVVACYKLTQGFPASETYGLVSQIRRSAVSVPANIAEGHARKRTGDYLHHLSIASGSLAELETHILIAVRLGFVGEVEVGPILEDAHEIGRMLAGLIQKLGTRKP